MTEWKRMARFIWFRVFETNQTNNAIRKAPGIFRNKKKIIPEFFFQYQNYICVRVVFSSYCFCCLILFCLLYNNITESRILEFHIQSKTTKKTLTHTHTHTRTIGMKMKKQVTDTHTRWMMIIKKAKIFQESFEYACAFFFGKE